jgi:hypothetical protein
MYEINKYKNLLRKLYVRYIYIHGVVLMQRDNFTFTFMKMCKLEFWFFPKEWEMYVSEYELGYAIAHAPSLRASHQGGGGVCVRSQVVM